MSAQAVDYLDLRSQRAGDPMSAQEAREAARQYGVRTGEGSGGLRYFARTGVIGPGLRAYLTDDRADEQNMPPGLARLARYVRTH